ncbi:hypothetical protein L9F63_027572, partial [Diploptera punctata]
QLKSVIFKSIRLTYFTESTATSITTAVRDHDENVGLGLAGRAAKKTSKSDL